MSAKRVILLYSVILFLILIMIFRLFYLTTYQNETYASHSINSYKLLIDSRRGYIFDRNLVPLVSENKKYKVAVLPSIESKNYLHSVLTEKQFLEISDKITLGKPFTFESDVYIPETQDVKIYMINKRYNENPLALHFIGYCDSSLKNGISGIEKAYDNTLKEQGSSITISYSIDATGKALSGADPVEELNNYNSSRGIVLTIDSEIQKIAQDASRLINNNGSILITDVSSGEILAGVSLPEYDRNNIASSISSNDTALLNRNLCAYNIGSTFKIIVSSAALSKGVSPSYFYNCTGNINIDDTTFSCHKKEGHGCLTLKTAFANSCNPYFVSLGKKIGARRLLSMASDFGLGKEITLCNGITTSAGKLPLEEQIENSGDLANISFGQGTLMATPVHIAKIISIVANGGYDVEPTLVLGESDDSGKITINKTTRNKTQIITKDIAEKIREYMVHTVNSGTGKNALPEHLGAGGKTASAETGWTQNGENIVQAWFSGFYPANKPKYAIVILCEAGGSGAATCAPVFKEICDKLYQKGYVK